MAGVEILSAVVTILVSLGAVFVAYGRQWAKLSVLIENLSKAVERLTSVADTLSKDQANLALAMERIKADVKSNTSRIQGIESRLDNVLKAGFMHCAKEAGEHT